MPENDTSYRHLRERYPEFCYEGFRHAVLSDGLHIEFDFRMGEVAFHPTAVVERRPFLHFDVEDLDAIVFNIGMVELVSYWKCSCSPRVKVRCGKLDDGQIAFWRKLYWHGLGEFFYTNGIAADADDFMAIETDGPIRVLENPVGGDKGYLVPIGGGKDSVVTLELLRKAGCEVRPLVMNPRGATEACARVAGFPIDQMLVVRRTIDPTLLQLNKMGYLNGHTPFSAMLAFYTLLCSALSGVGSVALSNEWSANESTVLGSSVNHQYSKSLEFEDDFRRYCANLFVSASGATTPATDATTHSHIHAFNYFSFLRPLSELQIARLFSRFPAYHEVFRSCNVGSKQDLWCCHCAKCLFAYIILSPFIPPRRLRQLFGADLLNDLSLEKEMRQLLGMEENKPFECVGTVEEVRIALSMAMDLYYQTEVPRLLCKVDFVPVHYDDASFSKVARRGNLNELEYTILQEACLEKIS